MTSADEPSEYGSIYVDEDSRYIVSLIVGYSEEELKGDFQGGDLDITVATMKDKMKAAALAALDLTRDGGQEGTHWYVYDREFKTGRFFEQGELEDTEDE